MLIDEIALTMIPEVGTRTAIHLLECFGSAEAVFSASVGELVQKAELRQEIAKIIVRKESHPEAEKELAFATRNGIRAITPDSPEYPRLLKECSDYPTVLYVKGDADLNTPRWLSVVGTRQITPYGAKMCEEIISDLAAMFPDTVIVSGLAFGVDIAAHRAAMNSGLTTIAVVAHALNRIHPVRHTESARRIVNEGGAVVTEYHTGSEPDKSGFVQRNRIIAGLSHGTLIVESAARGGSLLTADMAGGYNRCVMAVPGKVGDTYSEGTNNLIKSLKAEMVCSAKDIADVLRWDTPEKTARKGKGAFREQGLFDAEEGQAALTASPNLSRKHSELLLALMDAGTPISIDDLSAQSNIPLNDMSVLLLDLEFGGAVRSLPGKMYIKY